jgi:hypothetical protein
MSSSCCVSGLYKPHCPIWRHFCGRKAPRIIGSRINGNAPSGSQRLVRNRMFDNLGIRVTGLVLNQIDPKKMRRYGYGDTYGAYSGYGAKYYSG